MEDASGACTAHILLMHSLQESSVLGQSPSCLFLVSDWNGFVAEILIFFFNMIIRGIWNTSDVTLKGKSGSTFVIFSSGLYFSLKNALIYRITICLRSAFF